MKPPINYYGGKGRLASWIASLLPPHRCYVEVCAGSAAVLFAKTPATHEILNDREATLVAFFAVLRDHPAELARVCRLSPYVRDEFATADLADPDIDPLERARRFFVRLTQGFNKSVAVDHPAAVGWASSVRRGSNNARSAANLIDRFHECAARLAHVTIENRPAVECIATYDVRDAVLYVDPPYYRGVRRSLDKRRADYSVEYDSEAQHRELAAACAATPATVFVSGYHCPLYDELYGAWHRVERPMLVPSSNHAGWARHAVEVVWSNRPMNAQLRLGDDDLWRDESVPAPVPGPAVGTRP